MAAPAFENEPAGTQVRGAIASEAGPSPVNNMAKTGAALDHHHPDDLPAERRAESDSHPPSPPDHYTFGPCSALSGAEPGCLDQPRYAPIHNNPPDYFGEPLDGLALEPEATLERAAQGGLLPHGEPLLVPTTGRDTPLTDDLSYSEGGYESSDDMDDASAARHCVNCTSPVWGDVCVDCGHHVDDDATVFEPVVSPRPGRAASTAGPDVVLAYDERFLLHSEGEGGSHPERPDRVRAVWAMLEVAGAAACCRRLAVRPATDAEIVTCHDPELVARVDKLSERLAAPGAPPSLSYCSDTYVNAHTAACARLSAGACVDVATCVVLGQARAGIAIVRPPGHHAESNTAMGFCYYNNAAVAARAAQAAGAGRVLIVDWDVHHGNGTQHIFEEDPSVLYISLHRYDRGTFYPGTGAPTDVGRGAGAGTSVNIGWPHGSMGDGDYLAAFDHVVVPIAREYSPDLIIISAGFDAVDGDPIGGCLVTPACYGHLTSALMAVAPTVALLEGGYNLSATARSTLACVRVVLGERPERLEPGSAAPTPAGAAAIALALRVQARHWRSVRPLVDRMAPPAAVPLLRAMHAPGTPPFDPFGDALGSCELAGSGDTPGEGEASAAAPARSYGGAHSPRLTSDSVQARLGAQAAVDGPPGPACEDDASPAAAHGLAALSTPSTSGEGTRAALGEAASAVPAAGEDGAPGASLRALPAPHAGDRLGARPAAQRAPNAHPAVERIWERGLATRAAGVSKRKVTGSEHVPARSRSAEAVLVEIAGAGTPNAALLAKAAAREAVLERRASDAHSPLAHPPASSHSLGGAA